MKHSFTSDRYQFQEICSVVTSMVFSWGEAILPLHLWFILLDAPHLGSQCPLGGTGGHVAQGHVKSRSVFCNLRLTREKPRKINVSTPKKFTFYSVRWPNTEVHFHTESPVCLKLRGRTHIHSISEWFFSSVTYADTFQEPLTNCSNLKMKWDAVLRSLDTKHPSFAVLYSLYQCTCRSFLHLIHTRRLNAAKLLLYIVIVLTLLVEKDVDFKW